MRQGGGHQQAVGSVSEELPPTNKLPDRASFKRQTTSPVFFSKGQYPSITISTGRTKVFNRLVLKFGSFAVRRNSGNGTEGQVGRQVKLTSTPAINQGLNPDIIHQLRVNRSNDKVASQSEITQCSLYSRSTVLELIEACKL